MWIAGSRRGGAGTWAESRPERADEGGLSERRAEVPGGARAGRVGTRDQPGWACPEREGNSIWGPKCPLSGFPGCLSTSLFSKFQFYGAPESWGKAALN